MRGPSHHRVQAVSLKKNQTLMASTVAPYSLFHHKHLMTREEQTAAAAALTRSRARKPNKRSLRVFMLAPAAEGGQDRQRAPPGVDTRIHWENPDEGWIGGNSGNSQQKLNPEEEQKNLMGDKFGDLLNDSSDSHYQFLGVSAVADMEEIKAAYRRLSKEYHPDTTSLPLKAASEKFMRLRQIYDELSNPESRRFYDWTLAQEAASKKAEKMKIKLEDPYQQDLQNFESIPDMVDRLGGRNMDLSDQAMTALTIDVAIIIFAFCSIIYVLFFKEPY